MKKVKVSDLVDNCAICLMRSVCKYADQTVDVDLETVKSIMKALPAGITYGADCDYYMSSNQNRITAPLDNQSIQPYLNGTQSYCATCPNNPAKLDHPVVGDSPCQWCEHNIAKANW